MSFSRRQLVSTLPALALAGMGLLAQAATRLLNVSYDVSREFYKDIGDTLVNFESEVPLIQRQFGDNSSVVYPARTKNPVSVVDKVVDKRGTRPRAEAYLKYLYSDVGQEVAARHSLRPRSAVAKAR